MAGFTHVLFDFFGTLVSYDNRLEVTRLERSYGLLQQAGCALDYDGYVAGWDRTFREHEQRANETLDEFVLDAACAALLTQALPGGYEPTLVARFRDAFLAEWNQGVRYLPEVAPLLAALAERFTVVLVSNTNHPPLVHGHLQAMGVARHFRAIVTSVEHGRRKPSPCIFHRALELTGGTPDRAVYVGDSYSADYLGAVAAGLHPLLIDPDRRHPIADTHRIGHVGETGPRLMG